MSSSLPLDCEKRIALQNEPSNDLQPPAQRPRRRVACSLGFLLVLTLLIGTNSYADFSGRLSRCLQTNPSHDAAAIHDEWSGDKTPTVKRQATYTSSAAASPTVLECFQVAPPVLTPKTDCSQVLMVHSFAFSYGMPFVGDYTPPSCDFNRVVMNFTVTSSGRQFDRLALMYFGDTEVWRTSTAEPVNPPGIRWEYHKDMTEYLSLWKTPQKLIFDLGNLIDDKYTGPFNTTLTTTFFKAEDNSGAAPPSDLIIPISKRQGAANAVSQFTLPADNATNTISFPRNVRRAVFSVSACGQANEEFWWSNVLQSDVGTFERTAGSFLGLSPFREVQVLIDGHIAGVEWPFPVIFTGGVVPSLHRPIVGIDAFDLREHEIDITPFLPLLCDGQEHTFTIRIAGLTDDGKGSATLTQTVNDSWYVTGKIFVWLDDDKNSITTGSQPTIQQSGPFISISHSIGQDSKGANETLVYDTSVSRRFITSGTVKTAKSSGPVTWSQSLSYSNKGNIWGYGYNQINDMSITGTDIAAAKGLSYLASYRYPLYANSTYSVSAQGNLTLQAHVIQGKQLLVSGASVFPNGLQSFSSVPATAGKKFPGGSLLSTTKEGTASFFQTGDGKNSSGYGSSTQTMTFGGVSAGGSLADGPDVELYYRDVSAVNGTVTHDTERLAGTVTGGVGGGKPAGGQAHYVAFAQVPVSGHGGAPRVLMR
jgi:hypothetical protein